MSILFCCSRLSCAVVDSLLPQQHIYPTHFQHKISTLTPSQTARKKLEARRLAYDTSLAKMQKAKREDFRVEEELRSQKAKYDESSEDVYRRMEEIREAETDSVADLTAFVDAELAYHDRCRDILQQLRGEWPG